MRPFHRQSRTERQRNQKSAVVLSQEILDRVNRVLDYHQSSKYTDQSVQAAANVPLDWANQPSPFRTFAEHPKVPLPTTIIDAPTPSLGLLAEGIAAVPEGYLKPPQDLKTLATWLYMADGVTTERQSPRGKYWLRTCTSSAALFPYEVYVAAFAIDGLDPGLYHYSVREFALRKLREGDITLAHIKRGRPDLEFLKTVPGALLVSTVFCRPSWKYRQRAYRYALIDAGHLVQNLITAGNGLGVPTTTRLRMNEKAARELIGVPPDAPFSEAESVQAMVVWADEAHRKVLSPPPPGLLPPEGLPPIARRPLAAQCKPYGSILATHHDCVAPGMALRDIRPPLTELSVLPPEYEDEYDPADWPPHKLAVTGPPIRQVLLNRRSSPDFVHESIPRDRLWDVSRLAFRGGSYYPVFPAGPHVGLVRPMWVIHDVAGVEPGVWHYDPETDKWWPLKYGDFRMETRYLALDSPAPSNASAVCFVVANLRHLMSQAGPDIYRLVHLEAGAVAQRIHVAASAMGLGCAGFGAFYDDEVRRFLELGQTGWEVIYDVALGVPAGPEGPPGAALPSE